MRPVTSLSVIIFIVLCATAVVLAIARRSTEVEQPIRFDHALHLQKAGLQCLDCHTDAERSVYAGLPGKESCLDCHDIDDIEEQASEQPELAKLLHFAEGEGDIPWVRVAVTEPDVFFSHRRHVAAAGLECAQCHPGQETLTAPPRRPAQVMSMAECMQCHEQRGASIDCLACHR